MKKSISKVVLAAAVIAMAAGVSAQGSDVSPGMENVMSAGADHKALDSMIGTFEVKAKTWAYSTATPVESTFTATNAWVLGNRYLETRLEGSVEGDDFSEIGYLGFDAVRKGYEAVRMDTENAGMVWYRGEFDASGQQMTLRAEVPDPRSGLPSMRELKISIEGGGDHVVEVWVPGPENMLFKMKELRCTRKLDK